MPRLLLALPQWPQDPASGAARTARTVCEMAAEHGWEVRAIGTTASEGGAVMDAAGWLRESGVEVDPTYEERDGKRLRYSQRGVSYTVLDTRQQRWDDWEPVFGKQFDRLFDFEIRKFQPDVVLTYGGSPAHVARLARARAAGARIAFCVFNTAYLQRGFFEQFDAVLTPGEWLAGVYRKEIGLESTPLPTPVDFEDVLCTDHDPIFLTMVNPSIEKGLFFLARFAEELGRQFPEIPLLCVESRGTAGMLQVAGKAGGFDLTRHENLMFAPATPNPAAIFQPTKVLLVPSVWEEASGRVVAEALINGIPPIVSNRGGLEESCNGAGFVLPLPSDLLPSTRTPVGKEAVQPWLDLVGRLFADDGFYQAERARSKAAASIYRREILAPRYVAFLESVLRG